MSTENCEVPSLLLRNQDQPRSEEAAPPKTMEDLPPELLTKILELVATLDGNKKNMLGFRLVKSQWKQILDPVIENMISSGKFEVVPALSIEVVEGALNVRSPTRVADSMNPFPFNSLRIIGTLNAQPAHNHPERSQFPMLSLPAFASRFGGNLTTFTFCNQLKMPINSLAAMLRSMPNLKRLSLEEVKEEGQEELVIPTAPLLPNLTTLEITFHNLFIFNSSEPCILLGWLIGSYSAQLVRLHVDSRYPLPPLVARHRYSVSEQDARPIVTTSESAFRNLKELYLTHPNKEFLVASETPALKRLSLSRNGVFPEMYDFDLRDVTAFIEKCSSTLETLSFDWGHWTLEDPIGIFPNPQLELGAAQVGFPRLKTVSISYPCTDLQEIVLSAFLAKFRALKTLHLRSFRDHRVGVRLPVVEVGNGNNQNDEEVAALKNQLAPVHQRIREIQINKESAASALDELTDRFNNLPREERHMLEAEFITLSIEMSRLKRVMGLAQLERSEIYNQLAALGENTKEIMVQQLLEREGFWSNFPSLKTVTVSSGDRRNGDVSVVRRTDDA